ncbi:MAG: branched-chain amino acid ABC transporter permease/ATP-binding protein [Acidimicrobiaceae bacterium]|nr:branched-chain amino acid ABC transporter permease/ATP-binding protein [Acidimicrobiaceae bacterium]
MEQYLLFAVVGLGFGSIYAAVSMGVVITYRGTGVINFATGAMAMWGAYVYDELVRSGDLVFPVAVVPHSVSLGEDGSLPFALSFVLALASCSLIGLLVHFAVFRPLRRAPVLARVVASVGVLLTIQALIVLQFTSTPRNVPPILPNEPVSMAGISFSRDRLWLTAVVVLIAVALWAWFRFTRLGLAIRASAENERAVGLARYSPQLLAGTTWVLSSTVVGAVIILSSPTVILNPLTYVLAIVPALAAALIGRLSSIGITVSAALALGVMQSIVVFQASKTWWPDWAVSGLGDAVPFVVIVLALFFVGDALPSRGAVESDPLPEVFRPKMRPQVVIAMVLAAGAAVVLTSGSYRFGIITSMIITIITLSLVVLTGLVGQISLAQAGIAGTAGFALSKLGDAAGIPFPISPLLAALVATAFGVLVGIPALRIRGAQLAVVTLAGAVALEKFIFRNPSFTEVAGNPISDPTLFGLNMGVREGRTIARVEFGILVLILMAICAVLVGNLARSATGRRFLAVRSNERAGASIGISIANTKLLAFGIASFMAGLGGSFIGYSRGQLSADSFTVLVGLSFMAFAYLGGITSVSGAVIGGTFAPLGIGFVILDRNLELGTAYGLLAGIGLVLTAIFNPEGIAGANRKNFEKMKAMLAARAAAKVADAKDPDAAAPAPAPPLDVQSSGSVPEPSSRDRPSFDDAPVVLAVDELTVRYGGLKAVDEVSLRVREGEIVGLIGPNGAGKTTMIDALTGFVPSDGRIVFDSRELTSELPYQRARMGLSRTWQSLELFGDLSVRENAQVAQERASIRSVLADFVNPARPVDLERVDAALDLVGLANDADARPGDLPLGRQKLVGVARALASSPRVMLADEPAAGLDTAESRTLGREIVDIAEGGVSILLVDHDMGLVLEVCDYIYVLDFGQIIAEGTPADIRANEAVIDAYLGSEVHT